MLKIIRRISRICAFAVVYVLCAYGYMAAKGFVIIDGRPVLSNQAHAEENAFATGVSGNIEIGREYIRAKGSETAPLTMYAFSSMACSHCGDFHSYTLPKLERDFIATGKLRYVFIHFPLDAASMRAAKLSYCLPAEKYDGFILKLYKKKDWLFSGKSETLDKYAKEFGLSDEDIKKCDDDKKMNSDILMTLNNAIKVFGVKATPSFIVEGADGKELIVGTHSYGDFKEYLDGRLLRVK